MKWLIDRRPQPRALATVVLLLSLAACTGLGGPPAQPPRVSLADVGIAEFGLLEQTLRLSLRVQNPNDVAIGIAGLSYQLEVNGRKFGEGVSDQRASVPRLGEARLQVTAVTSSANVLRQLRDLQKGGRETIGYRISGTLNLEGGGSAPFEHAGEVPLPSLLGGSPNRP